MHLYSFSYIDLIYILLSTPYPLICDVNTLAYLIPALGYPVSSTVYILFNLIDHLSLQCKECKVCFYLYSMAIIILLLLFIMLYCRYEGRSVSFVECHNNRSMIAIYMHPIQFHSSHLNIEEVQ